MWAFGKVEEFTKGWSQLLLFLATFPPRTPSPALPFFPPVCLSASFSSISPFLLSTYYTPGPLGTVLGTGNARLSEVVIVPPSQDLQSRRKTLNHQMISQKR